MKRNRPDVVSMATERFKAATAFYVPKANRLVIAAAGNGLSIRAEPDTPHPCMVALQAPHMLTTLSIPEMHLLVIASAGNCYAMG